MEIILVAELSKPILWIDLALTGSMHTFFAD